MSRFLQKPINGRVEGKADVARKPERPDSIESRTNSPDGRGRGSDSTEKSRPPNIYISGSARVQLGDQIYHRSTASQDKFSAAWNVRQNAYHSNTRFSGKTKPTDEEVYNALSSSLAFPRMDARLQTVSAAMIKTSQWLFDKKQYLAWLDDDLMQEHHGFLWIKGKPGTGKSTLMKVALERTNNIQPHPMVISYFFNARSPHDLEKSLLGLCRSLAFQLLQKSQPARTLFLTKFRMKYHPSDDRVDEWLTAELESFFIDTVRNSRSLCLSIFIDALDEGNIHDVRRLVAFLSDLTMHSAHTDPENRLRVCFSSRHYPHITIKHGQSLILEDQVQHSEDVRAYVNVHLHMGNEDPTRSLSKMVEDKAGPIFLWAVVVVEILNRMFDEGFDTQELTAHLENLPSDLDDLYDDLLFQRPPRHPDTPALLLWALFAARSLSPEELYAAVTLTRSSYPPDTIPTATTLRKYVLNGSKGLLEVVRASDQRQVVQFIHETVRDYLLLREGIVRLCPWLTGNITGHSHDLLKSICLLRLRSQLNDTPQINSIFELRVRGLLFWDQAREYYKTQDLLQYATAYLFQHANVAAGSGVPQDEFLKLFSAFRSPLLGKWLRDILMNPEKHVYEQVGLRWIEVTKDPLSFLYTLVVLRPYRWTGEEGSDAIVQALLAQGVAVNTREGFHCFPLHAAITYGSPDIVRDLVNHGADLNAQGDRFENALHAATQQSDDEKFYFILQRSPELSESRLAGLVRSALAHSSRGRLQVLLDRGFDIRGAASRSILRGAASDCGSEAIRLWLEAGADVDEVDEYGDNALISAVRNGRTKVVEVLVRHGANLRTVKGRYPEILASAADKGSTKMVKILLEYGQEYEDKADACSRALAAARRCENLEMVKLIQDHAIQTWHLPVEETLETRRRPTVTIAYKNTDHTPMKVGFDDRQHPIMWKS